LFEGEYFDEPHISDPAPPSADNALAGELKHPDSDDDFGGPPSIASSGAPPTPLQPEEPAEQEENDKNIFNQIGKASEAQNETLDQTTLLQNEEESFALAPIEAPVARGKVFSVECW
jgi:hypothetical protein